MKFNATLRSVQGTSASRRLRHAGRVPAIVYGGKAQPLNIELDHNEIYHALRKEEFHASILSMDLEGKAEQVLLRSVQWHPYKQQVLHLDFQRVDATQALTTRVPLHFINGNESPAVKVGKTVISHLVTELEISCLPGDLPASIVVDLSTLEAGATFHLSDTTLPKGVTFVARGGDGNPALASAPIKSAADEDEDVAKPAGDAATPPAPDAPAAE
jgi:large subunit ribosomal protein L25